MSSMLNSDGRRARPIHACPSLASAFFGKKKPQKFKVCYRSIYMILMIFMHHTISKNIGEHFVLFKKEYHPVFEILLKSLRKIPT